MFIVGGGLIWNMTSLDDSDLPPETVEENSRTWKRTKLDAHSFQWVRPMDLMNTNGMLARFHSLV